MYKLDIPLDLKDKAAIERRRRAEKERQGRIFNSKYRQIAVRNIHIHSLFFFYYQYRSINTHLMNKFKIVIG